MKNRSLIIFFLCLIISVFTLLGLVFNKTNGEKLLSVETSNLLRIHIRANSNQVIDQEIKYKIKDEFVDFLTPFVVSCNSLEQAIQMIENKKQELIAISNKVLKENNFEYETNIKIGKEYFPTRSYNQYTLNSGVYNSIIVELGTGEGNNWWCVIYPPLCFTNFSNNNQNIVYKSKIMEIINKFFNGE